MQSTLLLYIGQIPVQNILVFWNAGPDASFLGTARNEDKGLIFRNDRTILTRCSWNRTDFPEATLASSSWNSRHTFENLGWKILTPFVLVFIFGAITPQYVSRLVGRCRTASLLILVLFPNPTAKGTCASAPAHYPACIKYSPPRTLVCARLRIYQALGILLRMSIQRLIFPLKLI